jgi:hypothetical protein
VLGPGAPQCDRLGGSRLSAKTAVGPLMHAAGLLGKGSQGVRAAAQPHPDALRLAEVTKLQAALLALVSQATTLPACERVAGEVQHCYPPAAIFAVDPGSADKPRTSTTKMAGGPSDGDALFGVLPLAGQEVTRAVTQCHRVLFGAHKDAAGRLARARPSPRKGLPRRETTTARPVSHIDRLERLASITSTEWPAGHSV